jgi:acetyltransferase-like isoleucine patch superfamily enzyme
LLDNLYDVLEDIFQWKWRFCKRNKNCAVRKNTVKVKEAPRKVAILQIRGNHMGKRRSNVEFSTFYWKSRGEANSIWPNKSVINNRTFFGDNFEIFCKETNLYYFQNQGKYASSSKWLNGWCHCGRIGKKLQ